MRESHRLLMKAWELEEKAEAEPDPIKAQRMLKQADQLWLDALNAREEPWKLTHTIILICLGAIIVFGFAAMCSEVIMELIK